MGEAQNTTDERIGHDVTHGVGHELFELAMLNEEVMRNGRLAERFERAEQMAAVWFAFDAGGDQVFIQIGLEHERFERARRGGRGRGAHAVSRRAAGRMRRTARRARRASRG